jgi:acyl-CoA synthetase (AMP-forming)/AMP-acid ligase II
VLNVSGHRMGTAEIESALVLHEAVAEAAVVGYPHDIKGQGIYAYVTPMAGVEPTDELKKELVKLVRTEIGPIATVDIIQWAPGCRRPAPARSCAASCARSPPGSTPTWATSPRWPTPTSSTISSTPIAV